MNEVYPTASPADSSITGMGGAIPKPVVAKSKKRKETATEESEEGAADVFELRKNPPEEGAADATESRNNPAERGMENFAEGSSDDCTDEVGDMGDSDDEGQEADLHNEAINLREVLELSNAPINDDDNNLDDVEGAEFACNEGNDAEVQLLGVPDGWVPPGPPPDWIGYQPKGNAPQPSQIDNPGAWSLYSFGPKYKKEESIQDTSLPLE